MVPTRISIARQSEIPGKSERGTARSEGQGLTSDADTRDACIRLQRAVRRSESYVAFRHTAVTFRHAATADNSSHGSEATDTVQDIKLVRSGGHDATCVGPMLSGVVFRFVNGEKRPLRDQRVGFYSAEQWGGWDVYATTNAEGRFEFAGLSRGPGSLLAGDCSDAMDSKPIEIRGEINVVDFDLTAFIQSCPWIFLPQ